MSFSPAGAEALGPHFSIFKSAVPSKRLIISAHGCEAPTHRRMQVRKGTEIRFYCHSGASLYDAGLYVLAAGHAKPVEVVSEGGMIKEYHLAKYRAEHYSQIAYLSRLCEVDVVVVRNRQGLRYFNSLMLTTYHLFDQLHHAGLEYQQIEASHCRVPWHGFSRTASIRD